MTALPFIMKRSSHAKTPTAFRRKVKEKIVKAETRVVQTTNCPARRLSAPNSWVIGTLETATGEPNRATKAAK